MLNGELTHMRVHTKKLHVVIKIRLFEFLKRLATGVPTAVYSFSAVGTVTVKPIIFLPHSVINEIFRLQTF